MNNDEKNREMRDQISGEMEARIVAWVSGEASVEESAELGRLVAGNPALAAFKGRIEAATRLAADAAAPDRKPLRMSEGRRAALLREISSKAAGAHAQTGAEDVPALVAIQRRQRKERRWMIAVAACLTTGLFLSMMIPSYQKNYSNATQRESQHDANLERAKSETLAEKVEAVEFDEQLQKKEVASLSAPRAEAAPRIEVPVKMPALPPSAPEDTDTGGAIHQAQSRTFGAVLNNARSLTPVVIDKGLIADSEAARASDAVAKDQAAESAAANAPVATHGVEVGPLSSYVVNEAEDRGRYTANSTLAGTRVRPDLKNVASSISVVTEQFLQDTSAGKAENLLAFEPKTALSNISESVTTTTTAAAASLNGEGTVLSPFEVDASQDEESYKAIDAAKVAGLQAPSRTSLLYGPKDISIGWDSIGPRMMGTGSPAGIPVSAQVADAKAAVGGFGELSAAKEPVSTFSLHVSDVSFRLAQAALSRGETPDPAQVRPEEFYNAFNYGDPAPAMSEKIACHTEQAVDPVMQQRNLLRIAMKVPTTGHGANQPLRLTVLLDTSGSMEREDRADAVKSAMKVLVSLLGRSDRVTLVGFARSPRLLAEQVPGDKAGSLLDIIAKTPPDGGTNLEEAIKLGSELAQRQFTSGAQNRIVLLTDGAANLGDADPAHLAALVESLRQRDIAFDACGVGSAGINDSVLEALTRKGSGRYYVLDSAAAADEGFARQVAGSFRPAAENVKVQVRFNPSRVGRYRLIGFENHRLNKEDFRNDKVAAAALASGEAAVALYEVEALPQGDGDLGEVYVRFHDTATGRMVERSWALPYDPYASAFDKATPSMQLAGTAALLAEKLRGGARADAINLAQLAPVVNALRNHYSHEVPVQELAAMYQQMRRMRGE